MIKGDMYLEGDLNQMVVQKNYLQDIGFVLNQVGVYPVVKRENVKRVLYTLWFNKIDGWWNYYSKFIDYAICTEEEFTSALRR